MLVRISLLLLAAVATLGFALGDVDPVPGFKCKSVSAREECNIGLNCTSLGAECQRCTTDPARRVRKCKEMLNEMCAVGGGDPVACGERIVGSCGSDGFGGFVCIGFPGGDCGTTNPNCALTP